MKYPIIAIEGNIGSGKTTLAKLLAQKLGAELVLETFENNPFLPKFYSDHERYALPMELFFLMERYEQLQKGLPKDRTVVSDYTLVKSLIFARATLKGDELMVYERIFKMAYPSILHPDLTIFLQNIPTNLVSRILERGRPYEKNIKAEYLEKIDSSYRQYYGQNDSGKVLIVDVSQKDFLKNRDDLEQIVDLLEGEYAVGVKEIKL